VMAQESFKNPEIAAAMNTRFVNIKIDREERPDLDQIYKHALALMGEQGGWPLTMFLTPDGEPYWGGTYFPPAARWGRPGFAEVLEAMSAAYAQDRDKVAQHVAALREAHGVSTVLYRQDFPRVLGPQLAVGIRMRLGGVAVMHGPANALPLARYGLPGVVTVHDLAIYEHPEWFPRGQWFATRLVVPHSIRSANLVICPSQATAGAVARLMGVGSERCRVIPHGVEPDFALPVAAEICAQTRARYALPESYILQVGTVQPRKNYLATLRALARIPAAERVPLLIAGGLGWDYEPVIRAVERVGLLVSPLLERPADPIRRRPLRGDAPGVAHEPPELARRHQLAVPGAGRGGDALIDERAAEVVRPGRQQQLRQPRPERAHGELAAHVREVCIDRGAHRRETHQLVQALPLRQLHQLAHPQAHQPRTLRFAGIDVRRHAEIDQQRRRAARVRAAQPRQHRGVEQRLAAASGQDHRTQRRGLRAEALERQRLRGDRLRQRHGAGRAAVDDEELDVGRVQQPCATSRHGRDAHQRHAPGGAAQVLLRALGGQVGKRRRAHPGGQAPHLPRHGERLAEQPIEDGPAGLRAPRLLPSAAHMRDRCRSQRP